MIRPKNKEANMKTPFVSGDSRCHQAGKVSQNQKENSN
jgi:hypothetical protein